MTAPDHATKRFKTVLRERGHPYMASGRCVTNTFLKEEMWCCTRDEGGPLDAGGQAQASNHCKLLSSRAMVVSVAAKGGTRSRQV